MEAVLLRMLAKVVDVMEDVMMGLAPEIVVRLVSVTAVVVLRFVPPLLSLFHPSLLTSLMRGGIVAVVAVVAGLFIV